MDGGGGPLLPAESLKGCPNVLIEAISCGCPAVAADVGGIPELLTAECGLLVPARNTERLAEGLRTGLSRTWDRAAISRLRARTWDHVARETYAILKRSSPDGPRRAARPVTACGSRL